METGSSHHGPRRIGKYILYEALGAGGMGRVHRARILGIGGVVKDLCVKRIRNSRLSRAGALDAFVAEARMWMRLAHANIVPVFDFGRSGGEYYLAMEWVSGSDLRAILDRARMMRDPLAPEVAAHVTAELARALDYAHNLDSAPIVHRDVKPENVLISHAGDVRLTDFGVAVAAGDVRGAGGTPVYMAPEQRAGGAVEPACDIHALGRILEEMLTGEAAGRADRDSVPLRPLHPELAPLVARMVAPAPGDRPTAREVADGLESFVARARAAGGTAARDRLSRRAEECLSARRWGEDAEGPPSGELRPELSFLHDGSDPAFLTQMTTGAGNATSPTIDRPLADDRGAPTEPTAPASERPGDDAPSSERRLGRYELCFELASGGMASVYLARAEGPGGFEKLVALKRIHPHLANDPEFVEMFLDEARIASRINHPNVCSVFDFGRADGTYFIAMEYIMGETLSALLSRITSHPALLHDPRWPAYAARIVADACEGLHAAHELRGDRGELLGVIHRDISPQNLFLGYDGSTTVVDFGIARAAGRIHSTQVGRLKGKLAYVAPEQGRRLDLDRRADIWSMGVVLWELLCGSSLFRRETKAETVTAVLGADVPAPSRMRRDVPAELDRVVLRALSPDREARYPTARELGRDLNRFVATAGEPVTAAELAEWMEAWFREEKARREELIEQSRRAGEGPVPRVSRRLRGKGEGSDSDPLLEVPVVDDLASTTAIAHAGRPRRRPLWLGGALAVLLVAGGVAVGATGFRDDGAEVGAVEAPASATDTVAPTASPTGASADPPETGEGSPAEAPAAGAEATAVEPDPTTDPTEPASDQAIASDETIAGDEPPSHAERRPRHAGGPPGTIGIATPGGWADVYVGGRRVGRAPGEVRLPAGTHLLRLRPFGRGPERRHRVRVPAGGHVRLVVPMTAP